MLHIMHGGYDKMTRNQLKGVPVPHPTEFGGRSDRWQPIQHYDLAHGIIEVIRDLFGYHPLPNSETYAVAPNGAAMIGGL